MAIRIARYFFNMGIDIFHNVYYIYAMCITMDEEKAEKLCSGFSLLDENEQGYIWGILEALLFAKLKMEAGRSNFSQNEKQGVCSV